MPEFLSNRRILLAQQGNDTHNLPCFSPDDHVWLHLSEANLSLFMERDISLRRWVINKILEARNIRPAKSEHFISDFDLFASRYLT
jgi:hypothetical protein